MLIRWLCAAKNRFRVVKAHGANQFWEVDLMGYLDDLNRGNKFIMVVVDHYSKRVETAALKSKDQKSDCHAIKACIIDKHGAPARILTDNGKDFLNNSFHELCSQYSITHETNSPGHHETVGAVERLNKSLRSKLKKMSNYR
ncbi:hypothetical protein ENBRE01_2438 [Enteropsectra breve]|nr:hypothetical protein ENBRE01_2438 [Enteropsectra breve]